MNLKAILQGHPLSAEVKGVSVTLCLSAGILQSMNESEVRVRERFISRFSSPHHEQISFRLQTHFILGKTHGGKTSCEVLKEKMIA
jgi:hypothetical protein